MKNLCASRNLSLWGMFMLIISFAARAGNPSENSHGLPAKSIQFVENKGQLSDVTGAPSKDVRFSVASEGFRLILKENGFSYQFEKPEMQGIAPIKPGDPLPTCKFQTYVVDMKLAGANPVARIEGLSPTGYFENHYTARHPEGIMHARGYRQVIYHDVYPGIDWIVYALDGGIKYEFIVHPGADPSRIRMKYSGAVSMIAGKDGLVLNTPLGTIQDGSPASWMEGGAKVASAFHQNGDEVGFELGNYDRSRTLIIDPNLLWATYYGGAQQEAAYAIANDPFGDVYMAGFTMSNGLASGGHLNTYQGNTDAMLVKFDMNGNRLWATYYGGTEEDIARALAVDASGNVYLGGQTLGSADLSTPGAFQTNHHGNTNYDAFLVKFDSAGVRQWGTYYGHTELDVINGLTITSGGLVVAVGETESHDSITTPGAFATAIIGQRDAFIAVFNTNGAMQWATYYGGSNDDFGYGVCSDASGNIILCGQTGSNNGSGGQYRIATAGAFQMAKNANDDGFVASFTSAGARNWGTYLGANQTDGCRSVGCDASGNIYVGGYANSANPANSISTPGSHQAGIGGSQDAYLVKFSSAGARQWGTFYGGTADDMGYSVSVSDSGFIYLAGSTMSTNAIASGGLYNTFAGIEDAFVARFTSAGVRQWGTYYGDIQIDRAYSVCAAPVGRMFFGGLTESSNNIANLGYQSSIGGQSDMFLAKTGPPCIPVQVIDDPDNFVYCIGSDSMFFIQTSGDPATYRWQVNSGGGWTNVTDNAMYAGATNDTLRIRGLNASHSGWSYRVIAVNACGTDTSASATHTQDNGAPTAGCRNITVYLDGSGNASTSSASVNNGSSDNCSFSLSLNDSLFDCNDLGTVMVVLTATDPSNNTDTCQSRVTVIDNILPSISCPSGISASNSPNLCSATVTFTEPAGTDNCRGAVTVRTAGSASGSSFPVGVTTQAYRVTAANGQSASCSFNITVTDNETPSVACPAHVNATTASGTCAATVTYSTPQPSDNCPGATVALISGQLSGTSFSVGTTTNVWRATDASGNTGTCSFNVIVSDAELPSISCPANITQNAAGGQCRKMVNYTAPVGTDNCPGATTTQISGIAPGNFFYTGVTTNVFKVTDASGNSTSCSFTVTIVDGELPSINCPANINANTASGRCDAQVSYSNPVVTDNCPDVSWYQSGGQPSGSYFNSGVTTNSFVAEDAYGNTNSCSFTVTVTDNQPPSITCPANISTNNTPGVCVAYVTYSTPSFSDNCPGATLQQTAGLASGSNFPVGVTTNTFRVDAVNGATVSCSFTVTVADAELPVITCPLDITVPAASGICSAVVNYPAVTATDNCPGVSVARFMGQASGSSFAVGSTFNAFEATASNGATAQCGFYVNVVDNQPPVLSCPSSQTVAAAPGACSAVVNYTQPTATDNCTSGSGTNYQVGPCAYAPFPMFGAPIVAVGNDVLGSFVLPFPFTFYGTPQTLCFVSTNGFLTFGGPPPVGTGCCNGMPLPNGGIPNSIILGWTDWISNVRYNVIGTAPNRVAVLEWQGNEVAGGGAINAQLALYETTNEIKMITVFMSVQAHNMTQGLSQNGGNALPVTGRNGVPWATQFECLSFTAGIAPTLVSGLPSGSSFPVGTTANTYSATDASGNAASCTFYISVTDNNAPTALCRNATLPLGTYGSATLDAADVDNGSSDLCGAVTLAVVPSSFSCPDLGPNNVVLTVTDLSGNTSSCSAVVTVVDLVPPVAGCRNVTLNLSPLGTATVVSTLFTDNSYDMCGAVRFQANDTVFNCTDVGTQSIVLTITDPSGNTTTCASQLTVLDVTPPQAFCQDVTVNLGAGGTATLAGSSVSNGSTDACGISQLSLSTSSFNCTALGTTTVILTVTDPSGNTSTCSSTARVADPVPPVALCRNMTVNLGMSGTVTPSASLADNGSSDNCSITGWTLIPSTFDCSSGSSVNTTLRVTDASGNTSTCALVVTVQDNVSPVALCRNATVQLGITGQYVMTGNEINNGSTDICPHLQFATNPASFGCGDLGSHTVALTVTDPFGNSSSCSATVTVVDTLSVLARCRNITAYLTNAGNLVVTPSMVDNGSGSGCGISSAVVNPNTFVCGQIGYNNVVLTITDLSAATSSCMSVVTVVDSIRPVARCRNVSLNLNTGGTTVLTAPQVNNGSTDQCGISGISLNPSSFTCNQTGLNQTVLTVTDIGGNTSTCSANVTVYDITNPVAVCRNLNIYLNATGSANITAVQLNNGSHDNCQVASFAASAVNFTCQNIGQNPITLTVYDNAGNQATCSSVVTVMDTTRPVVLCRNATVNIVGTGTGSLNYSQVDNGSHDNCSQPAFTLSQTSFTCGQTGNRQVTLTVMDGNGNSASCVATVFVTDQFAPGAFCRNVTLDLNAGGTASLTAAQVDNNSRDNCGTPALSISTNSFNCGQTGVRNVTLTVTDGSGNTSTCSSAVTIRDITPPVANCRNTTANLNVNGQVTVSPFSVNNNSTDNCGINLISLSRTDFNCGNLGVNNVVLTVTDNSGNSSTCSANVTITETVAPVAVCRSVTLSLDQNGTAVLQPQQVDGGSTDFCGILSRSLSRSTFSCVNRGVNTITYTVLDFSGNSGTCSAQITVNDPIPPVAVCRNLTVNLSGAGTASVTANQLDNGSYDNCAVTGYSASPTAFTCVNAGANNVTLVVSDASGNTSQCTATVTVRDVNAPVATCRNATTWLNAVGSASVTTNMINNNSTDNCTTMTYTLSSSAFGCYNRGNNAVTLTVTDGGGNSTTCNAVVSVLDTIRPVARCRSVSIPLDAGGTASLSASTIDNGSSDNCGITATSLSAAAFTCQNRGANTVVLTVSDASGNSSSCSATVTVNDVTAPVAACRNATVQLGVSGNGTLTVSQVNNNSSDNCGAPTLSVSASAFNCSQMGTQTVVLTAVDATGNSSSCTATVTVRDMIAPVAACRNATAYLNATGNATLAASSVDNASTDNCGVSSRSISPSAFTCGLSGGRNVTLTVTDASGNTSTCTTVVIVRDTVRPVAACTSATVTLDASGSATLFAGQVNGGSSDNCAISSTNISRNAFGCGDRGVNPVTLTVTDVSGNTASCSASVTVRDPLAPVALCRNVTASLTASGSVTVSASQFDNGSYDNCGIPTLSLNTSLFRCNQIGANPVTLRVTDASGNTSTCTATVTINDPLAPVAVCTNVSVTLSPAGSVTVNSSQIDNGSYDNCSVTSISLNRTTFTCSDVGRNPVVLTVRDASGNSSTCSANVSVFPRSLDLSVTGVVKACGYYVNCGMNDGILHSTIVGGCPPYTYLWSTGATGSTLNNAGPGTYSLTVRDNGGQITTRWFTITAPAPQISLQSPSYYGGTQVSCAGATDGSITATVSGSAGCGALHYAWNGPNGFTSTAPSLNSAGAGKYLLQVTDTLGCTARDSIILTAPQPLQLSFTAFGDSCSTPLRDGSALVATSNGLPPFHYMWSSGDSTFVTEGLSRGYWSVTVTDLNGCTATDSVFVGGGVNYSAEVILQGDTIRGCMGDSVELDAHPGYVAYLWSTGTTGATDYGWARNAFSIRATDSLGCYAYDTIWVDSFPTPVPQITAGGPLSFCYNGQVVLRADSGYAGYVWNTGSVQQIITADTTGYYTVRVTDQNGCRATTGVNVVEFIPAGNPNITLVGNTLCSSAAAAYTWYFNGVMLPDTTECITPTANGDYRVIITDSNGCSQTSGIYSFTVGVSQAGGLEDLDLYPNPTQGEVYIRAIGWDKGEARVVVTDLYGRTLDVYEAVRFDQPFALRLDKYSGSVYFVRLEAEHFSHLWKVVRE